MAFLFALLACVFAPKIDSATEKVYLYVRQLKIDFSVFYLDVLSEHSTRDAPVRCVDAPKIHFGLFLDYFLIL